METTEKKININLVMIGHIDSGKSTTAGHLMNKIGIVSNETIKECEMEANLMGKGSFKYAWIFDKSKEERERGLTLENNFREFETDKFKYRIIDPPGIRFAIDKTTAAITQADFAILVVSAGPGEFEAGIFSEGQTMEHALLAAALGVKILCVAITKMDGYSVNYSEERFNQIVMKMKEMLKEVGVKSKNIPFVPISGWKGENLITPSENLPWYEGQTLLQTLDNIKAPKRLVDKPLRIPVSKIEEVEEEKIIVTGRIEAGIIKPGMNLTISPPFPGLSAVCKEVRLFNEVVTEGKAGDNVKLILNQLKAKDIKEGCVISNSEDSPIGQVVSFEAQIVVLNISNDIISQGYETVMYSRTGGVVPCRVDELISKVDKFTGEVLEESSENLKSDDAAVVRLFPLSPICIEEFGKSPIFGRFVLKLEKKMVAVGAVKKVNCE